MYDGVIMRFGKGSRQEARRCGRRLGRQKRLRFSHMSAVVRSVECFVCLHQYAVLLDCSESTRSGSGKSGSSFMSSSSPMLGSWRSTVALRYQDNRPPAQTTQRRLPKQDRPIEHASRQEPPSTRAVALLPILAAPPAHTNSRKRPAAALADDATPSTIPPTKITVTQPHGIPPVATGIYRHLV